jgi:hypothetical protein
MYIYKIDISTPNTITSSEVLGVTPLFTFARVVKNDLSITDLLWSDPYGVSSGYEA